MADSNLKRKIWLSQLTAARMQCTMYEKKIFFGKASPLLAMEHLAATRSLKELQDVFYGSIEGYKDKVANSEANDELWWPPSAPLDLHQRLKESAAREFTEELYKEHLDFQTSLLCTCTKLYSKNVLMLLDFPSHVDVVKERAMRQD